MDKTLKALKISGGDTMIYVVIFAIYIGIMIAIGMYFSNKNENMSDYI